MRNATAWMIYGIKIGMNDSDLVDDTCHCGGRNGEHWHRCPDRVN